MSKPPTLDYRPPPERPRTRWWLIAPLLVVLGVGVLMLNLCSIRIHPPQPSTSRPAGK